ASSALEQAIAGKQEEEYRRLLYVGMTRAEDRLILCGYHGKLGPAEGGWHALVRRGLAGAAARVPAADPRLAGDVLRYSVTPAATPCAAGQPAVPAKEQTDFPAELRRPLPAETILPRPLTPSGAGAFIDDEPAQRRPATRSPVLDNAAPPGLAVERGAAIHRLLQHLPAIDRSQREAIGRRYLQRVGGGWPEGEGDRVWNSVAAVLNDPRLADLFSPESRAEVTLAGHLEIGGSRRAISGRIDRLAVTDRSVIFVDYKTGRNPPRET